MLTSPLVRQFLWLFVSLIASGIPQSAWAQAGPPKVPTPVEFMAGNNRMFYQMVVKKKFSPQSKLGLLSVSSFAASYDRNLEDLDLVIPVILSYQLYKGFGIVGGATLNNQTGFAPLLGVQHSFANREWVAVTIASLLIQPERKVELFGIYEYKPAIGTNLNLYTRLQFLYVHSTRDNLHARSFLQLRTGLKMKAFNFGVAANLDQYGPVQTFKPNYGIFVGWAFQ